MRKRSGAVGGLWAICLALTVLLCLSAGCTRREGLSPTTAQAVSGTDKAGLSRLSLASPSGRLRLDAGLNENGSIVFTVTGGEGLVLLRDCTVGVAAEECDFSEGLRFVRQEPPVEIDETYDNLSGKRSRSRNHYCQAVMVYAKGAYYFDVTFRVYDDGFAYRFGLRAKDKDAAPLHWAEETGTFALPDHSAVTAQRVKDLSAPFNYEGKYLTEEADSLTARGDTYCCFPALVNLADETGALTDRYLLLSEAALFGESYGGSVLCGRGENVFGLHAAPQVKTDSTVVMADGFLSPWRYGIYGSLADVVESDVTENLAPPSKGDYSWVKPGVTAWMWLSEGFYGQRNKSIIRDYIDLAAEMGWQYLILDEGWQPASRQAGKAYSGTFSYFDQLLQYAEQKGVGLIVWVKYEDLDTPEEREILREWAAMGIKGIKADFFDSEDPKTMDDFRAIYEICADCHLLVNCHGSGKPTGERRTYPNVLSREAVDGEEFGEFRVANAVYWAYIRNVVGPADITPRLYPRKKSGNTLAAQLACCVLFENGLPCMASDAEDYRRFGGRDFYRNLPAAWDDIRFLGGTPGEDVSIARRAGEDWYAASLTVKARKSCTMPLTFLDEGAYEATVYSDIDRTSVDIQTRTVTREDTLTYSMKKQSGFAVVLRKKQA